MSKARKWEIIGFAGIAIIILIALASLSLATSSVYSSSSTETADKNVKSSNIIYVGSGPGNDSTTIQGGINLASAGDTIYVYEGAYYESLVINKATTLFGEDMKSTIICGTGDQVVEIATAGAKLSGFTISAREAWGGVILVNSNNNEITNCRICLSDGSGIGFYGSSNNLINNCSISYNDQGCIFLKSYSNNNLIYHNNFINNSECPDNPCANHPYDACSNYWDNGTIGNYWSDYNGTDEDEDGIGDTPYNISGGSNQDKYPMIEPLEILLNKRPIVNITFPLTNQTVNGAITIHGKASDPDCNESLQKVEIKIGGGAWQIASGTTNWTYNWDTTTVMNGEYTICARSDDGIDYSIIDSILVHVNNVGLVHNLDKDTFYSTIQEAINNASAGNTLFVYSGIYYENVIVNKSIALVGESKENTTINGGGSGDVVCVTVDSVEIESLDITNSGYFSVDSAVEFQSSNCTIKRCSLHSKSGLGIYLSTNTKNITVSNCHIFDNHEGIEMQRSCNNNITGCTIYNNSWEGILLWDSSNVNTITNCKIYNNECGVDLYGDSSYNSITSCYIHNNSRGVSILHCSNDNKITNCTIMKNPNYGVCIQKHHNAYPSTGNLICHNNFINNTNNAYDECTNYWNKSSEGNYWSDYDEPSEGAYDNNTDGIVDSPYAIPGGTNYDNYPFMEPSGWEQVTGPVHNLDKDTYYNTIQEAIDDADPGNTIEVSNGTYYENVIINKTITLLGEDRNNTIIDGSGTGDVIYISADWVNVSGFGVRNSGSDWDNGVKIIASNVYINNCNISANRDGVHLSYGCNITIKNCNIISNEWIGIDSYSQNVTIKRCNISNNGCDGISIRYCPNSTIENCNISQNNGRGLIICDSPHNVVKNCSMYLNTEANFIVGGEKKQDYNHSLDGNRVNGKTIYYYFDAHGLVVEGISTTHITFAWCSNITLRDANIFAGDGIFLMHCEYCKIVTSNITKNTYVGILGLSSNNITVSNSTVCSNKGWWGSAICLNNEGCRIENCLISNNTVGIELGSHCIITNCKFSNNVWCIDVEWASHSTIAYCNLSNNEGGIYVGTSSSNNTVQYNNFINNVLCSVYDEGVNFWKNNYWSDYNGSDANSDGIGDTPYNILGGDNKDNYPLMPEVTWGDTEKPVISLISPDNSSVIKPGTALEFEINDENLWKTGYSVNNGETQLFSSPHNPCISTAGWSDRIYNITIYANDWGMNEISKTFTFIIDSMPPTITVSGVADDVYYNTDVAPMVDISDANIDITSITLNGNPFTNGTVVSAENTYTLFVQANDKAGNTANKTITFVIDKTPPTITITESSQTTSKSSFTMSWSASENVQCYEISTDGVNWENVSTSIQYTFTLSKGGNTLYVRGTDIAGNKGTDTVTVTYMEKKAEGKPGIIPGFETGILLFALLCVCLLVKKKKR